MADLHSVSGKYMEEMNMVFEKCQTKEVERINFFKEMLLSMHKCLDNTKDPK